jgi:hypothetical protein
VRLWPLEMRGREFQRMLAFERGKLPPNTIRVPGGRHDGHLLELRPSQVCGMEPVSFYHAPTMQSDVQVEHYRVQKQWRGSLFYNGTVRRDAFDLVVVPYDTPRTQCWARA